MSSWQYSRSWDPSSPLCCQYLMVSVSSDVTARLCPWCETGPGVRTDISPGRGPLVTRHSVARRYLDRDCLRSVLIALCVHPLWQTLKMNCQKSILLNGTISSLWLNVQLSCGRWKIFFFNKKPNQCGAVLTQLTIDRNVSFQIRGSISTLIKSMSRMIFWRNASS